MSVGAAAPGAVSRWRHLRAIVLLPLTNAVLIPGAILGIANGREANIPWPDIAPTGLRVAAAAAMLGVGVGLVVHSIALFVRFGRGTLAPWDPPHRLVVAGMYRRCRNPMKLGLFLTLLGEALMLGSVSLAVWFAAFAAANIVYVRLSEEPALAKRFGAAYAEYRRNVPRWWPRPTPWPAGEEIGGPSGAVGR